MSLLDSTLDFLSSNWEEFLIVVVGSVVAGVILFPLLRNLEKPKFSFEVVSTGGKLGFSISVKKKTIKDARIRCNNINYSWENGDKGTEKKDLYVGDTPSIFFPYEMFWDYAKEIPDPFRPNKIMTKKASDVGISLIVREIPTQKTVFKEYFTIRNNKYWGIPEYKKKTTFDTSIRLIGEGVEEVKDYSMSVGLEGLGYPGIKDGKFTSPEIWTKFGLKKRHLLW